MHERAVLVRYSEIALKKGNRKRFVDHFLNNLRAVVESLGDVRVVNLRERVELRGGHPEEILPRIAWIPGVSSTSVAVLCDFTIEALIAGATAVVREELERRGAPRSVRFRVTTRRGAKEFPLSSMEIDHVVGGHLDDAFPNLQVDLSNPELTVGLDVRGDSNYVYADRTAGPGGLPTGSVGRAICLLSGGIDSPVAAYLAMKRGVQVHALSFHSAPFLGEESRDKVRRLARHLTRFQPRVRLFSVPFTRIQMAIRDGAPEGYRTVLYRRSMHRLAERVAREEKAIALITGESLGQVASQTLENLHVIGSASGLPVLQPLIAYNKEETVALARRLGTYPISKEPHPDCCTVFQPRQPIIQGRLDAALDMEQSLPLEALEHEAFTSLERDEFRCR